MSHISLILSYATQTDDIFKLKSNYLLLTNRFQSEAQKALRGKEL